MLVVVVAYLAQMPLNLQTNLKIHPQLHLYLDNQILVVQVSLAVEAGQEVQEVHKALKVKVYLGLYHSKIQQLVEQVHLVHLLGLLLTKINQHKTIQVLLLNNKLLEQVCLVRQNQQLLVDLDVRILSI